MEHIIPFVWFYVELLMSILTFCDILATNYFLACYILILMKNIFYCKFYHRLSHNFYIDVTFIICIIIVFSAT